MASKVWDEITCLCHSLLTCIYIYIYMHHLALICKMWMIFQSENSQEPLLPAWIIITFTNKCGMRILIHSKTSISPPLKFRSGLVVPSHTFQCMWLLIHIKNRASDVKRLSWDYTPIDIPDHDDTKPWKLFNLCAELWCFLWFIAKKVVKQILELPVIWKAMMLM